MDIQNRPQPPVFTEENKKVVTTPPLKPNTWLWQAIIVALCCNTPFGIVALIYSARVNSAYSLGDYERAEYFSRRAKIWALTGLIVGLVYTIYMVVTVMKSGAGIGDIGSILDGASPSPYNF